MAWKYPEYGPSWLELTPEEQIGTYVRSWRELNGLLQRELAEIVGHNKRWVYTIEHNPTAPPLRVVKALAASLGTRLILEFIPLHTDEAKKPLQFQWYDLEPEEVVSQYLVAWRKLNKVTQAQLAEMSDVQMEWLSKVECLKHKPAFSMLERLAAGMDTRLVVWFEPVGKT